MLGSRFKPHNLIFALAASALAVAASSFAAPANPVNEPVVTANGLLTVLVDMRYPGDYLIGLRHTTPKTIVDDLRTIRGNRTPTQVRILLKSNAGISYEEFISVLKPLQAEGYDKIGLIKDDIDLSTLK